MPSKSESKAFFIIISIAFASLLSGSVFAQDCVPSAGKQCYYYDELNRLKEVHYPDGMKIIYQYDELGNRTYMENFTNPVTLTIQKTGTGTGTVTSNPERINCGATCSKRFNSGTQVTLTPAPYAGSAFTGWSGGGCSGTGSCTITLTANTTVTATFMRYLTLAVNKSGNGSGSVTSSPVGINCGADCTEEYTPGAAVTLTATADSCRTFAGWSGGGCSGTGTCTVTMDAAKTVTATFKWATPTVNFTAIPASGSAPFDVAFSDASACATAWSWNFGDPDPNNTNTSTLKNPVRAYRKPGTYSVSLTAMNPDASSTLTKNGLISADPCPNYPAKIGSTYYQSLAEAVNAAASGATIMFHAVNLTGPISISKELTINGGYNCWYTSTTAGATAIRGDVTIPDGSFTVTMDNILVN